MLEQLGPVIEFRLIQGAHGEIERQRRQHTGRGRRIDGVQRVRDVGVVDTLQRTCEVRSIHGPYLRGYAWPENIRALGNTVSRIVVTGSGDCVVIRAKLDRVTCNRAKGRAAAPDQLQEVVMT